MGRVGRRAETPRVGAERGAAEREARVLVAAIRGELAWSLRLERVLTRASEDDLAALRRILSQARGERGQAAARAAEQELAEAFLEGGDG